MRFSYISCPINSDSPVLPKQPNTSSSSTSQPIPTLRTIETQSCQTRSIHYPDSNSSIRYTDSTQRHSMQKHGKQRVGDNEDAIHVQWLGSLIIKRSLWKADVAYQNALSHYFLSFRSIFGEQRVILRSCLVQVVPVHQYCPKCIPVSNLNPISWTKVILFWASRTRLLWSSQMTIPYLYPLIAPFTRRMFSILFFLL